jgi:pimeloyl-ACP methyl ester carboxylesterase
VVSQPLPPLRVTFEGDEAALDLVRAALNEAGAGGGPSLLVAENEMGEADYRLQATTVKNGLEEKDVYRIRRLADAYPLAVDTPGFDAESAAIVIKRLEHIARWERIAELRNKTTGIPEDAVSLEVFLVRTGGELEPMDATNGLRFEYERQNGEWKPQSFQVKLSNHGDRRFYCMLLDLSEDYAVYTSLLLGDGLWLEPGQEAWAHIPVGGAWRKTIDAFIPNKAHEQGMTEWQDILKLIVSTEECDAKLLQQDSLPVSMATKGERLVPPTMNTLERIMYRVGSRSFGNAAAANETFVDWRTTEINSTIYRPMDAVAVAGPGETAELAPGVSLVGHPSLNAKARLMPLDRAGRDVGNLLTPGILRDHPDLAPPFEFTSSRGGAPGLSALELFDVADPTVVTAEEPLVLQLEEALAEDELILPYAYDGEFFLPLGYVKSNAAGTTITLERLPDATTGGERDLLGSIKIMFQKMVGQHIGLPFPYPVLAAADVASDGKVTYHAAEAKVRERVDAANNILLYIHGMFGDSRGMAGSARAVGLSEAVPALADEYDLILTFDYESINTEVEDTARALKQRLAAVGLGPDHGKHLHIISHSLGGLVARWFIEREGGNTVVEHLVTVGTPHLGTPWPTIQAWATTALTLALNGLSTVAWPVKALSALLKATELIDVTADAVAQDSKFLANLNASPDPGAPYTLLAGDTSVIPAVAQPEAGGASRLERLLATLQSKKLLYKATALAFFNQPNDIAVSVDSAYGVPAERTPKPETPDEIACDHVSYFGTSAALKSIAEALD